MTQSTGKLFLHTQWKCGHSSDLGLVKSQVQQTHNIPVLVCCFVLDYSLLLSFIFFQLPKVFTTSCFKYVQHSNAGNKQINQLSVLAFIKTVLTYPDGVAHSFQPSMWEAKANGSQSVQGQPGLYREF